MERAQWLPTSQWATWYRRRGMPDRGRCSRSGRVLPYSNITLVIACLCGPRRCQLCGRRRRPRLQHHRPPSRIRRRCSTKPEMAKEGASPIGAAPSCFRTLEACGGSESAEQQVKYISDNCDQAGYESHVIPPLLSFTLRRCSFELTRTYGRSVARLLTRRKSPFECRKHYLCS